MASKGTGTTNAPTTRTSIEQQTTTNPMDEDNYVRLTVRDAFKLKYWCRI